MNERRIATSMNMAVRQRNYRRARDRALTRLAQAYPDDYKKLIEQEKANDEAQGRKWLDINGTTAQLDTRTHTTASARTQAGNGTEDEGDRRGKA